MFFSRRRRISRVRCHQIIEEMNQARGWTECLDRDQFIAAVRPSSRTLSILFQLSQLMRSICEHRPDWVAGIWTSVSERAEAESEPIRLAAVIVASSLIRKLVSSQMFLTIHPGVLMLTVPSTSHSSSKPYVSSKTNSATKVSEYERYFVFISPFYNLSVMCKRTR